MASSISVGIPWSRDIHHTGLRLYNSQAIFKINRDGISSNSHHGAACTLGRVSQRAIKYTYNLVDFTFTPLLIYFFLTLVQPPPIVSTSCVLLNPPYLSYRHLTSRVMNFFFRHLRQSMRFTSRDLFTFWVNTRMYISITHRSRRYAWTPASLSLLPTSYLIMGAYPLLVSRDVPNDLIPRPAGTSS